MCLFPFKSNNRRKTSVTKLLVLLSLAFVWTSSATPASGELDVCKNIECGNDVCVNGTCLRYGGWHDAPFQTCSEGYYKNPANSSECIGCQCNNSGNNCNQENGKCFCTTVGTIGDNCEKCDSFNHYQRDLSEHGSCFYDLVVNHHFLFNLSKKVDLGFTQINFQISPTKSNIDVGLNITCSIMAKMNITVKTGTLQSPHPIIRFSLSGNLMTNGPEEMLLSLQNCTNFQTMFLTSEYLIGSNNNKALTTFYVYIYDLKPTLQIKISFTQHPKLYIINCLISLLGCALLILMIIYVVMKIKCYYNLYKNKQVQTIEYRALPE